MYYEGIGIKKNKTDAGKWLRAAANQGNLNGQLRNKILNESREAEAHDLQSQQYYNNSAQSIHAST